MTRKECRSMKVYGKSGYNYKNTPTIMLKGQWLKEMGFEIGKYVQVKCEDGKLVITLDEIKGKMVEAETLFMERETKRLQKEFEREKERLHVQFVAEEQKMALEAAEKAGVLINKKMASDARKGAMTTKAITEAIAEVEPEPNPLEIVDKALAAWFKKRRA